MRFTREYVIVYVTTFQFYESDKLLNGFIPNNAMFV